MSAKFFVEKIIFDYRKPNTHFSSFFTVIVLNSSPSFSSLSFCAEHINYTVQITITSKITEKKQPFWIIVGRARLPRVKISQALIRRITVFTDISKVEIGGKDNSYAHFETTDYCTFGFHIFLDLTKNEEFPNKNLNAPNETIIFSSKNVPIFQMPKWNGLG